MAKFHFKLESLLKLRRLEEDRAKASFLLLLRDFRGKEAEILAIAREREAAKVRFREPDAGMLDIEAVLQSRRFINILYQRMSEKRTELGRLRPKLDEARTAHQKAAIRRRALEKLRERAWREHLREMERVERRDLDELGQVKFLRDRAQASGPAGGAER
jgi:flagellar protein FliJ